MRREYTMVVVHDAGFVTEKLTYNVLSETSPNQEKVWHMLQKHLNQSAKWRIIQFHSRERR